MGDIQLALGKIGEGRTPKFLASVSAGVWPTQSLIEKVPNSEKYPLSKTSTKVQTPGPMP